MRKNSKLIGHVITLLISGDSRGFRYNIVAKNSPIWAGIWGQGCIFIATTDVVINRYSVGGTIISIGIC